MARTNHDRGVTLSEAVPTLLDYYSALGIIFGGCCVNVFAYEQLLLMNSKIGSALTFSQMLFITLQSLPSFIYFTPTSWRPRVRPREIPFREWILQVLVMSAASLMNNWAYAYRVPMTLMIVFRSAGLAVSMLLGKFVMRRTYSRKQVFSVLLVSSGVLLATLSRPSPAKETKPTVVDNGDIPKYSTGIAMLTGSLLLSSIHGMLGERTYKKYGPHWREAVFYNHALSLPVFLFLGADVKQGLSSLATNTYMGSPLKSYLLLALNLASQLACVSGVNKLSSQTSSVSTNLVLTVRKAMSLLFSIWWFGNGYNFQLGLGSVLVFVGGILFTLSSKPPQVGDAKVKVQ